MNLFVFLVQGNVFVALTHEKTIKLGIEVSICFIVNIYSKLLFPDNRRMCDHLCFCKSIFGGDIWCVLGDFNATLSPNEHIGSVSDLVLSQNVECFAFSSFIAQMDLLDLPLLGIKSLTGSNLVVRRCLSSKLVNKC